MKAVTDFREPYRQDFLAVQALLPGANVPWLARRRAAAIERFLDVGFPTSRDEDWKYTDIRLVIQGHLPAATLPAAVDRAAIESFLLTPDVLVFVDGRYQAAVSAPPSGVQVASLADMLERDAAAVEPWLREGDGTASQAFATLNDVFMRDGAFVRIAAGMELEAPLQLLFVASGRQAASTYLRNIIVAEANSRATLIESYVALDSGHYLTNGITDLTVGAGAVLEHYRIEHEAPAAYHFGSTPLRLARDASYTGHDILRGGRLARHEINASLDALGAACKLNGLYVGRDRQHLDVHARIDHRAPGGTSRNTYKGVLDGQARGVFSGRTVVHPDAQKTDARQSNHSLLLSATAEADSRPQFEIYADDVKCAHGSSVGSLDPEALFYLRTRALDEDAARRLLVYAFAGDVLARMRFAPLRQALGRELAGTLLAGHAVAELVP